jgi:hypothetical protein
MKLGHYYSMLCNPAKLYFVVSVVIYLIMFIQNITTPGKFSLGIYTCDHKQTPMILLYNAFYIILWTFILNLICKGSTTLSWVIIFFPFILSLFILGYIMFLGITGTKSSSKSDSTSSCGCSSSESSCSCNKTAYQPSEIDMYSVSYSQYGSPY